MKKIFIILNLISVVLFANSLKLDNNDIKLLKKIKSLVNEPMMKYSLMAIAIKESSLGKNQINKKSNDYGLFQSNIKTVLKRQKLKDTKENRKIYSNKLLTNVNFAAANAVVEIMYWRKVHKDNWANVWASYNTGFNYKGKIGFKYAKSIFKIIKKLKFEYGL